MLYFFNFKNSLFTYLFVAVLDLRCCAQVFSNSNAWASHCGGFSPCGEQVLELGLSSCGTRP